MPGRKRAAGVDVLLDQRGLALRVHAAMREYEEFRSRGGQKRLAEEAGVDAGKLSLLLSGDAGAGVTAETVLRLAKRLGTTVGWLLAGEGGTRPVWVDGGRPPTSSVVPSSANR